MATLTLTSQTSKKLTPGPGELIGYCITSAATADSNDTLDIATLIGTINFLICWDATTGDIVTATESSSNITIDTGGSTTDHTYGILVFGTKT